MLLTRLHKPTKERMTAQDTLKRTEIRSVLDRHPGSKGQIAESLGIKSQNISKWLKGQTVSRRIAEAANSKALELLEQEKRNAPAA